MNHIKAVGIIERCCRGEKFFKSGKLKRKCFSFSLDNYKNLTYMRNCISFDEI